MPRRTTPRPAAASNGLVEISGTFEITTTKEAYRTDVRTVELDHDGCHVVPQVLAVTLTAE